MAKKPEVKNVPAVKNAGAVSTDVLDPSMFYDGGDTGFEETGRNDYAIPFLTILQALSPQCVEGEPQYKEEFRPGMFFNTITEEYYSGKQGVYYIPAYYRQMGILWTPRGEGGGFKGMMSAVEMEKMLPNCTKDDKNHDITPDGLLLVDTREWYGLVSSTPDFEKYAQVLMTLKSTQLKKSRKWLSQARGLTYQNKPVKLWSQVYHLTTLPEKNDQGSWYGLDVKHIGSVPRVELFHSAGEFRELIQSGALKASLPEEDPENTEHPY